MTGYFYDLAQANRTVDWGSTGTLLHVGIIRF
jgi:hypothetical protein